MNEYYTAFTGGGSPDGYKGEVDRLAGAPANEVNGGVFARNPVSKLIGEETADIKATNPLGTTAKLIGKAVASASGFTDEESYSMRINYAMNKMRKGYDCVPIIASLGGLSSSGSHLEPFTADDEEDWIWIRRFNDLINMAATPLTDRQKALHLIGNLAGRARDAVDTLTDTEKGKYDAVVNKMVSLVNGPEQKELARRKLTKCRQEEGESVMTFLTRLRRIVQSAMQGKVAAEIEERLMEEFVDRISPRLSFNVKAKAPETLEEAIGLAKRYECLLATMASSVGGFGESPNIFASHVQNISQHHLHSAPVSMDAYDEEGYEEYSETPFRYGYYCHRCGEEGHIRRECTFQYTPRVPFHGQPVPYYPPFQNAIVQQPMPVYQPSCGLPQYQMHPVFHHGQVPTTCSSSMPIESNHSAAQTIAELRRKFAEAERRNEELIQKNNEAYGRY